MSLTDQKMHTNVFDDNINKPNKSSTISKKNLFFIAFAVIILQVADTAILWLLGSDKGLNSHGSGDSLLFTGVIFAILKCTYDKCSRKGGKNCKKEKQEEVTQEVWEEDCRKSATYVVDTMKVKGPPPRINTTSIRTQKKGIHTKKSGCEATIWVSSWWRPPCLNPKARKFEPWYTYMASTLNSNSAPFWPQEMANKEKELLESESGGIDAGEVVYRSSHWLKEIGFENKQKDPVPMQAEKTQKPSKRSKSVERAKVQKELQPRKCVPKSDAQPKKWVPKSQK
eukprot:gnl/MRDRNA2_/MRDRNA2_94498_c0_seq1.p1 gnl/MRDRNA2_/MRDRNA2_94498_c0~~gnl/MRDRNA2_/MRDRNA2_94498_c0_seq1.p1  ORF type:complete len:283 (-),score=61.59 gnl/MRDRNA2_/MRDRNA2_94498_c0_seq1:87-935(-)